MAGKEELRITNFKVMGFAGGIVGGYNEAGEKGHAARMRRAEGLAARNAAYSKAGKVERGAAARLEVAGENLSRLRKAQAEERSALQANEALRGVAVQSRDGGNERALDALYDSMASDLQQDASVGSLNAYNEAVALRLGGDNAQFAANAEADMLASMAKRQRVGAFVGGVAGVAGAVAGGMEGGVMGALQGSRIGSSFAWSLDPQMSRYASEGWEKDFLSLMQKK